MCTKTLVYKIQKQQITQRSLLELFKNITNYKYDSRRDYKLCMNEREKET